MPSTWYHWYSKRYILRCGVDYLICLFRLFADNMPLRKCCVLTCNDKTSTRHRFPKSDPDRMRIWLERIGNETLNTLTHQAIYTSYRICKKHFSKCSYSPGRIQLNANALPSLNLNGDGQISSVIPKISQKTDIIQAPSDCLARLPSENEADKCMSTLSNSKIVLHQISNTNRLEIDQVDRRKINQDSYLNVGKSFRITSSDISNPNCDSSVVNYSNRIVNQQSKNIVCISRKFSSNGNNNNLKNLVMKPCETSDVIERRSDFAKSEQMNVRSTELHRKHSVSQCSRIELCEQRNSTDTDQSFLKNLPDSSINTLIEAEKMGNLAGLLTEMTSNSVSAELKQTSVHDCSLTDKSDQLAGILRRYDIFKKNNSWVLRPKLNKKMKELLFKLILESRRNSVKKCAVPGCKDTTSMRHRFPKHDQARMKIWLAAISNTNLRSLSVDKIYSSYRVCRSHFAKNCFSPGLKRLNVKAVPTLYLPDDH